MTLYNLLYEENHDLNFLSPLVTIIIIIIIIEAKLMLNPHITLAIFNTGAFMKNNM